MIPTQNTWGTEALSWYSCWYSVTEAAMYFVLSWVWALTSPQYPGLCCDKVQCHHRHPAISRDHLLSDRASISNTLIVTARPARSLVMRMMSGSIVHQDYHRDSPSGDQRTHIPRLVSLPCCCTTLLPGTLSKMSINKMTFNRKVKIGSLLTAWHRYLVIDLYITIPNIREAQSTDQRNCCC